MTEALATTASPEASGATAHTPTQEGQAEAQAAAEAAATAAAEAEAAEAAEREAHIQRLLSRLSQNPDFPSMRESIRGIQKLARAENAHLRSFTDEILHDVPLSNKMLRLINTAFYSSVGGGSIDSLSRAISLMGFQAVGMLAASLKLFDNLPKGPSATRVQQEFSRALMAALLANEVCPSHKVAESTYLTALFQNLGRMLVWMHFPGEAAQIEAMTRKDLGNTEPEILAAQGRHALQVKYDNRNAKSVLYLSFDDLSVEVARMWGWPDSLQKALRPYLPEDPEHEINRDDYVRVACSLSNNLAWLLAETLPEEQEQEFSRFQNRWTHVYGEEPEDFLSMLYRVDAQWSQMSQVMNLAKLHPLMERNLAKVQSAVKRGEELPAAFMLTSILQRPDESGATSGPQKPGAAKGATTKPTANGKPGAKLATKPEAKPPVKPEPKAEPQPKAATAPAKPVTVAPVRTSLIPEVKTATETGEHLSRGIEELSELVVSDASLGEVLLLTMQILMHSLNTQRVIICLKDKRSGAMLGRVGAGDAGHAMSKLFNIPLNPPSDLFGMLCAKNADTLISDSSDTVIASRLPSWYKTGVNAPTFLILPLSMGALTAGMIYADRAAPNSLNIDEQVLKRLKTLRNQGTMAMHVRGVGGP